VRCAPFPIGVFLLSVCAGTAAAQVNGPGAPDNGGRRTMTALRLADGESVSLDGRLDEPFWARALPAADFIQQDPQNGRPATEKTEVRIVFDRDALYMGVTCFDSEPERWIGWQMRRDERAFSDDLFTWTIDTFLDGRTGYSFEVNPSGLMADALIGLNGDNREWDGIWNARVTIATVLKVKCRIVAWCAPTSCCSVPSR